MTASYVRNPIHKQSFNEQILKSEVRYRAVHSSGPGGQNVNKVASAALLLWPLWPSKALDHQQKQILWSKLQNHLNEDHEIWIKSTEFRDLGRNKSRCLDKLCELLTKALYVPPPRKPTKPKRSAQKKRIESKRTRGETKELRRKPKLD
jgi:ribosome-associated protein